MHRKTTSRRENSRIASKRVRAAERQAIDGGKNKIVHYDSWAAKPIQGPLFNEVCNGKVHKKAKVKPVACSSSPILKHEWLKDIGVFEKYSWLEDKYEEIRPYKMCVHCGAVKVKYRSRWYRNNRLLRSA